MFEHADARGVDEQAVAPSFVNNFRVAGHDLHPATIRRRPHRADDPPERFHGQPLFQNKPRAEVQRPGPAHRQVVDRAENRHRANIAAREDQGLHDIGISRESQPARGHRQHRRIMLRARRWMAEAFQEHLLDKLVHQLAAAPVRQ